MNPQPPIRLLAVDDQAATLQAYRWIFGSQAVWSREEDSEAETEGEPSRFALETCTDGDEAIALILQARLDERPFAVVFVSPRLEGPHDGPETAEAIRATDRDINIVIVAEPSELRPDHFVHRVLPAERLLFFPKPFQPHVLRHLASTLGSKWRAERQLQQSHKQLERQVA